MKSIFLVLEVDRNIPKRHEIMLSLKAANDVGIAWFMTDESPEEKMIAVYEIKLPYLSIEQRTRSCDLLAVAIQNKASGRRHKDALPLSSVVCESTPMTGMVSLGENDEERTHLRALMPTRLNFQFVDPHGTLRPEK